MTAFVIAEFSFKESNEKSRENNGQLLVRTSPLMKPINYGHIPNFRQPANEEGNLPAWRGTSCPSCQEVAHLPREQVYVICLLSPDTMAKVTRKVIGREGRISFPKGQSVRG